MSFQAPIEEQTIVPEGVYDATLIEVEQRDGGIDSKGFWLWRFEITDPATGDTIEVTRPSSPKLTSGTNAGQWIRIFTGKSVDEHRQVAPSFDFSSIEGTACRLLISVEEKDKGTFNQIEPIMAPAEQGVLDASS